MFNARRDYRFHLHRGHFIRHVNLRTSKGLEIGAFDLPLVKAEEGYCEFADYRSTAELQDLARQMKGHNPDNVAPIRYDLKQGYDSIDKQFDWIVTSHVIEHIPDVIGWLKTLAAKLSDGGILFLVVPDKRFTFDCFRRETTTTDLVEAHRLKLTQPSFAQVFDHQFYATEAVDPGIIWAGGTAQPPRYDYQLAMQTAGRALHEYVDTHCSVFTPESFSRLFLNLQRAGAIPFRLGEVRSTQANQMDFSAVLNRVTAAP